MLTLVQLPIPPALVGPLARYLIDQGEPPLADLLVEALVEKLTRAHYLEESVTRTPP